MRDDGVEVPYLNAGAGWRHPDCLHSNWERHQEVMRETAQRIIEWNERHGWRFRWLYLFTICTWDWKHFRYYTEEISAVADLAEGLAG